MAGRGYVDAVEKLLAAVESTRDVNLDLANILVISSDVVNQLICLRQRLAEENRSLAVVNLRPIVAEMLRNISASDLLAAGCAASEEPAILCPSEASP